MTENEKLFEMRPYIHKVQYYETDMMGVVHHSNYLRWMEEARIDLLEQIGFPYPQIEASGYLSPVLSIHTNYSSPSTYNDEIEIQVSVREVRASRFALDYKMVHKDTRKEIVNGYSEHCLINREFKPVLLKKAVPALYERMLELCPPSV